MKALSIMLTVLVMLFTVIEVYAENPCGEYEYNELMGIDQKEFVTTYCNVLKTARIYATLFSSDRGYKNAFDACYNTTMKMERIYMKRFKIENRELLMGKCEGK